MLTFKVVIQACDHSPTVAAKCPETAVCPCRPPEWLVPINLDCSNSCDNVADTFDTVTLIVQSD